MELNNGFRSIYIRNSSNWYSFILGNERNRCTMSWELAFYNFAICLIVFIFLTLVGVL